MENKSFINELTDKFGDMILETKEHNDKRITIRIDPGALVKIADHFYNEQELRFIIASGLHSKKGFEIFYHFSNDKSGHVINLHVVLPQVNPDIDTLTGLFSAAEWIEREIHELLGIDFKGHPNLVPLISKDNWPEKTYPYRKDFIK